MRAGEIEETKIPRNPLDVLAQQIVAIAADEEIRVDDLHALVTRAYPFKDLSRAQLENVLDMLSGRYPAGKFAGLRPPRASDRPRRRGVAPRRHGGRPPPRRRSLRGVRGGGGGPGRRARGGIALGGTSRPDVP